MEVLLDRRSIEMEGVPFENLEEVLLDVMTNHVEPGKMVTEVNLNGRCYSEEQPHDAASIPLSEIYRIEINTITEREMARQLLGQGRGHLEIMARAARKIAELFRIGDEGEANEQYAEFVESLRLFLKMLKGINEILHLDLPSVPFDGGTVKDQVALFSEVTDQMMGFQEQEDWILLADHLEYHLAPLLEEWREIVETLSRKAEVKEKAS